MFLFFAFIFVFYLGWGEGRRGDTVSVWVWWWGFDLGVWYLETVWFPWWLRKMNEENWRCHFLLNEARGRAGATPLWGVHGGGVCASYIVRTTYHRTASYTTFDNRNANYGIDGGHPGLQLRPLDAVTGQILLSAPFRPGGRQGNRFRHTQPRLWRWKWHLWS